MLDAGVVPAVIHAVEFSYPQSVVVLNHGFRACAAHRGPEQQQFLHLRGCGIVGQLVLDQSVGEGLKFFKIDRAVEFPQGAGGLGVEAEAERARTVVGGFQQVVEFAELCLAGVFFR